MRASRQMGADVVHCARANGKMENEGSVSCWVFQTLPCWAMSACSSTAGADELGLWELSEEPALAPHAKTRSPVKSVSSIKEKMEKMETSAGKLSGLLDTCGFGDGAARGSQGI